MRWIIALAAALAATQANAADIKLVLGAEPYDGPPRFELKVNDRVVASGAVDGPSGQDFSYQTPGQARSVSIAFTNDAAAPLDANGKRPPGSDRNLIIESVTIDGRNWKGREIKLSTPGVVVRGDALVLSQNATVQLPLDAASTPAAEPAPAPATASAPPAGGSSSPSLVEYEQPGKGAPIVALGDGLTAGIGGGDRANAYPNVVASSLGGRPLQVIAREGAPSAQLLADLQGKAIPKNAVTLIWLGQDGAANRKEALQTLASITRTLPNRRYLVLSVLPDEKAGKEKARAATRLNQALSEAYGFRYLDVGKGLAASDRSGDGHLNADGYKKVGKDVAKNLRLKGW